QDTLPPSLRSAMLRCAVTLDVSRPPSEVFAFLDDISKPPRWLSRCTGIEQLSPGPKGVGTTLRYSYKDPARTGTMDGVVSAYERDRRLEMKYQDAMLDVEVAFRLEPSGSGTRLEHAVA